MAATDALRQQRYPPEHESSARAVLRVRVPTRIQGAGACQGSAGVQPEDGLLVSIEPCLEAGTTNHQRQEVLRSYIPSSGPQPGDS